MQLEYQTPGLTFRGLLMQGKQTFDGHSAENQAEGNWSNKSKLTEREA